MTEKSSQILQLLAVSATIESDPSLHFLDRNSSRSGAVNPRPTRDPRLHMVAERIFLDHRREMSIVGRRVRSRAPPATYRHVAY